MITKLPKYKWLSLVICILISLGVFFRIYNLNWGAPFFFHPDERNIASSISQLSFPDQMNPHFFAYGTFPIYSIYFTGALNNFTTGDIDTTKVSFENAILIGRSFSLILSILSLYLIYKIGKDFFNQRIAIISTLLASFSVGLIQYSHYATFEMWLTFFTLVLSYFCIQYWKRKTKKTFLYIAFLLGLLIATKISSIILIPIVLLVLLLSDFKLPVKLKSIQFLTIHKFFLKPLFCLAITIGIVFIVSPFFWWDNSGFLSSMRYESGVGFGTIPVFYTQGFTNTLPLLYQLLKVYPFILNPAVLIIFIISLPILIVSQIKKRSLSLIIIACFLAVTFFSQAFLYVKWTRYYIPTLPYIYLLLAIALDYYFQKDGFKKYYSVGIGLIVAISFLFSLAYVKTALGEIDTRLSAKIFAERNIPHDSNVLSEIYDLGIIPFNEILPNIKLFNFYDLDQNPTLENELTQLLTTTDYIILPSQRIYRSRLANPNAFPKSYEFYQSFFREEIGFKKIYETPCDLFCHILYLGNPKFFYEETVNVFDRPTVTIFKKN